MRKLKEIFGKVLIKGYQPKDSGLDVTNPPRGGSGVPKSRQR